MEQIAKYVYQVYKDKSFTAAAKSLYISQPALSAAIARVEKEMNIRIFDRSVIPLKLTPQGRVYIDMVEETMESESNMRRRFRELSDTQHHSLSIGGNIYASFFLMSSVCSVFQKRYPDVRVTLNIGNTGRANYLNEKLLNDEIELLFSYANDTEHISVPIYTERCVIAMHKEMEGAKELAHLALTREEIISQSYDKNREIEDMSVFENIRFMAFSKLSPVNKTMEKLFGRYKSAPYKVVAARQSKMHYDLMCAGIGALVTTDTIIAKAQHDADDILFFVPKSRDSYRTIYLLRKQRTDDNPVVRDFINVAREVCKPEHILKPNIYMDI